MREIADKLGEIEQLLTRDRLLSAKAFGLLLLRRKFKDPKEDKDIDPTTLILERPGPIVPKPE